MCYILLLYGYVHEDGDTTRLTANRWIFKASLADTSRDHAYQKGAVPKGRDAYGWLGQTGSSSQYIIILS